MGTEAGTNNKAIEIAKQDKDLYAAVGIHPSRAKDIDFEKAIKNLEKLLERNHKDNHLIALGEIGLDYYRLDRESSSFKKIHEQQHQLFKTQIKLAEKYDLPLIIHARDQEKFQNEESGAYAEILSILKKHYTGHKPFVLHCISGPLGYLTQAIELGAYIGFCANITYKKANDLRMLLKYTPINRLLIETDAPFLPPQEYRGKVCEPWMITETAKFTQQELKIEPKWLLENTKNFFGPAISSF